MVQSMEDVNREVVSFFEAIRNKEVQEHRSKRETILNTIPPLVNDEKNDALYKEITKEEVREATLPDGFLASFFQNFLGDCRR